MSIVTLVSTDWGPDMSFPQSPKRARAAVLALVLAALFLAALAPRASATGVVILRGEESGDRITARQHIIALGAVTHVPWESVTDQWRIDQMRAQGARPILAHPYDTDFPIGAILGFNGVFGLEAFHKGNDFTNKWNAALTTGYRLWGFGADDSHNQRDTLPKPFTMVRAAALTSAGILAAIDTGSFYPTQGPLFSDLGVAADGKVFATTAEPGTFTVSTARGTVATALTAKSVDYAPHKDDVFVRIEFARISDGLDASSQPFYVHADGSLDDPYVVQGQWYKGNTHFHTKGSDGSLSPADAMDWYALQGYSWLSPGDHNIITADFERPGINDFVASPAACSPNGDGYLDRETFTYSTTEAFQQWLLIYDASGKPIKTIASWSSPAAGAKSFSWDGKYTSPMGSYTYAPDGTYTARVEAKDAVGNTTTMTAGFVLDRTLSKVSVSSTQLSPNGDGSKDTVTVSYTLTRAATVTLYARRASGDPARQLRAPVAQSAGSYTFVWNGRDSAGAALVDGTYSVVVAAQSSLGTIEGAKTVTLDVVPPVVSQAVLDPAVFPADGGATMRFATTEAGTFSIIVADHFGKTRRVLSGSASAGQNAVAWNGKDSFGVLVAAGAYTVKLSVKDLASNKTVPSTIALAATVQ